MFVWFDINRHQDEKTNDVRSANWQSVLVRAKYDHAYAVLEVYKL